MLLQSYVKAVFHGLSHSVIGCKKAMSVERMLEDCEGLREPSLDWMCVLGALQKLYSRN